MNLLVDSSFIIDHLKGDRAALDRWDQVFVDGDYPYTNEIVVCEVRAGLNPGDVDKLAGLLLPIEFVQPGRASAMLAGEWRYQAHRNGRSLSLADALIAAAADSLNAAVLTRNVRDFALTPVRVETY